MLTPYNKHSLFAYSPFVLHCYSIKNNSILICTHIISVCCGVKLHRIGLKVQLIALAMIRPNRKYQLSVSFLHPSVKEEDMVVGVLGFHAQQHFGK